MAEEAQASAASAASCSAAGGDGSLSDAESESDAEGAALAAAHNFKGGWTPARRRLLPLWDDMQQLFCAAKPPATLV